MERREFFRSLVGVPLIARPEAKNRREHHQGHRLYHGPMRLPARVLDIATRAPVYRTTCRHPVIRLALDGVTYVFRTGLAGDCYLGEIVQEMEGAGPIRVHVWRAIETGPDIVEILARKLPMKLSAPPPRERREQIARPILPPMMPPRPSWES